MKVGLLEGNSRSFTPIFVVVLAVLLVAFRWHVIEIGDIQEVSYSCIFRRYLRARATLVQNIAIF